MADSLSLLNLVRRIWNLRSLLAQLTGREIVGRYKGSFLGIGWSFVFPLLMLAVYTFVFSEIFKARWGGGSGSRTEFALVLFLGLIVYNIVAENVGKATTVVVQNQNFVKKVVFPLEMLLVVNMAASLIHGLIGLFVWYVFYLISFGFDDGALWVLAKLFLAPVVVLPLCLQVLGFSWFISSIGVYVRDVGQLISVLLSVLMFMSPIFYPVDALPELYQDVMRLNPMTLPIENLRGVLIFKIDFDWFGYVQSMMVSLLIAWVGFAWFQKTRKGFADVL